MMPAQRPPASHYVMAGILIAVLLLQSFSASPGKSPVYDEPPHIAAGLSYLATGVFRANLQHPPLLKEMSALVLEMAGVHWPASPAARSVTEGPRTGKEPEWGVGNDIIISNGPDRVLFWARLPFILLTALAGLLLYFFGRELVGSSAGLGALLLFALDPTIVAHSFLVTTDIGLATFGLLFFWAVWRYIQGPTWPRTMPCGLAMGAMLGVKFSAPFLIVCAVVFVVAARRQQPGPQAAPNDPCPCGSGKKYRKCHGAEQAAQPALRLGNLGHVAAIFAMAVVVVEALYFFPSDPFLYLEGLRKVNADHISDYLAFFHGDMSKRFYSYFAAAYLLKEPLATLILAAIGLFTVWREPSVPKLVKLFLLLPPAVFFVAMSIFADDMGVRYLIPAMPFAYLVGGVGLAKLLADSRPLMKYAAVALCLWLAMEAVGIYPDHLSYFNEMACVEKPGQIGLDGGSRCGPLWLDDSNVDWGQGLKQLRDWESRHREVPTLRLAYPDNFPPEAYAGLRFENFPTPLLLTDPDPGWYAVSAAVVTRVPAIGKTLQYKGEWLQRMQPVDIVGHAYYIYRVP